MRARTDCRAPSTVSPSASTFVIHLTGWLSPAAPVRPEKARVYSVSIEHQSVCRANVRFAIAGRTAPYAPFYGPRAGCASATQPHPRYAIRHIRPRAIVIFALLAVLALIWATRSIRQAAMWRPLVICGMPTRWYFTGREHA